MTTPLESMTLEELLEVIIEQTRCVSGDHRSQDIFGYQETRKEAKAEILRRFEDMKNTIKLMKAWGG